MKPSENIVSYRRLRPNNINSPEFRHLWLLLFWAAYAVVFPLIERVFTADFYYPMYCALDDCIPFCEVFIIPYAFWYFYLMWAHLYLLRHDVRAFKKMMQYFIITFAYAIIFCVVFPNCQKLRPVSFASDNLLTRITAIIYAADTSTNVSPSMHVLGTCAVTFALFTTDAFKSAGRKIELIIITLLICASTVFVKQHSVLDIVAALPVCAAAWFICFGKTKPAAGKAPVKKKIGAVYFNQY